MIYFLKERCSDYQIKIGYTNNIRKRLQDLQSGNPRKLEVMAIIEGDCDFERVLHNHFREYKTTGEWFKPSKSILKYIRAIKKDQI